MMIFCDEIKQGMFNHHYTISLYPFIILCILIHYLLRAAAMSRFAAALMHPDRPYYSTIRLSCVINLPSFIQRR